MITVAFLFLLVVFLYFYLKRKFSFFEIHKIPHNKPRNWFLGNLEGVGRRNVAEYFGSVYSDLAREGKGPIGGFYFFTEPALIVTDPTILRNILQKDFDYFHDRGIYVNERDDPLSAHLFSLDSTRWKQLRAKLTPTFTSGKMKMMFTAAMLDVSREFEKVLAQNATENLPIEFKDLCSRFTIDAIGRCAFGIHCNSLLDPQSEIKQIGMQIFGNTKLEMFKLAFISAFQNFSRAIGCRFTTIRTEKFFFDMVQKAMTQRRKTGERNDFLDLLFQLKDHGKLLSETSSDSDNFLTLNEIVAQCFVFFLAGFETSSTAMSMCLYELARNEDIQAKLRKHIEEIITKNNGLTYEALLEMPYLDQTIYETIRIYPSLTMLQRKVVKDYKVPEHDYKLPAGQMVIVPTFSIQRDPKYFEDPLKFDPERFSDENKHKIPPFAFLPFGEGPRACIGQRFGMMQTRLSLVTILRRFKVTTCSKTMPFELSPLSTFLQPKHGIWLKLHKHE